MPVSRTDLLNILAQQDEIANMAKDVCGIVLGRGVRSEQVGSMSITSVAVPAEVDLESVDTFQAVLPESPNRANNNVRKKRRTSTKAVFSVYKADSKQYKSVSPRRRSSVHPRIANKLIAQLSSNTLETGDMDDGFETREVDLAACTGRH